MKGRKSLMITENEVLFEEHQGTGWVILNRPKALNALSLQMVTDIYHQLKEWSTNDDVSLVCIKSQSEKAFCAGGDVRAICETAKMNPSSMIPKEYFATEYKMDLLIHEYPKPVLAFMDGIVMGGGVGLSVGAQFRIITEKTKWAMPEMNIGFFPDVGANYFLNQMPGKIGIYLALTSNVIKGGDILYTNAADYYMESSKLCELENFIKNNVWKKETASERLKQYLEPICLKVDTLLRNLDEKKINQHFKFETVEQIIESLEESASTGDEWAEKTRNTLLSKSPTSLKVTLELMRRGKEKTLKESFEMDVHVALNFLHTPDFFEGVRAVLVDKDHSPKWQPDSLDGVSETYIQEFFTV
ncbi:enoyl-CoA hydratase/isomerase family protein [Bacillus sp. FJAT-29790]|uniref:enoyl-CoA hydratase/isomerase family protein n=1 Tax=Bacillus sp. FJAT-29790 TaxID=1895002 RepID=UPI001C2222D0|nr:enoyl-CoA hydratase/isomerase family protein [Bacillus sp. FJAT-29790]MBU8879780.1 enoyl-CoA hydratase/isomerase family protein [Bacillus sp. FJAT-29790]